MRARVLPILAATVLMNCGSAALAATLTFSFGGTFTQGTNGGVADSVTNGEAVQLPSVTTGQTFRGTLSYSTDQPHTWNVSEQFGAFTLSQFSIVFGDNTLEMGIGPFGLLLENNAVGGDRISLSGADDTGLAHLNDEIVRAISSISLLDIDAAALSSTGLVALPDLALFEERRLQFSLSGYFGPFIGATYTGELTALSQTPLPAALPLFASVLIGGGVVAWQRRKQRAPVE